MDLLEEIFIFENFARKEYEIGGSCWVGVKMFSKISYPKQIIPLILLSFP